ncbi:MAG: hypothetical protein OXC83_09105 [Chloroflexi bacterium]|nr:hypothetical protein [Chloroflexota bacterium]
MSTEKSLSANLFERSQEFKPMQIQQRLIVPALGIVILLAAFILGVPLVYKVLLGLLGLAAAGTYFAPEPVQVETRIAIAAIGLVILLIVSSTAFWLILLSFGAIAALQFPHRHTLQRNPATIAWLSKSLNAAQAGRSGQVDGDGDTDEEAAAAAGNGESSPQAPSTDGALPEFVRMNVAGGGGLVAGVLVLLSVFMPWYGFLISAYGEWAGGENFSLRAAAVDLPVINTFFFILLALGVLSIISIGLPRAIAAIIAAAGLVVTLASYIYVVVAIESEVSELSGMGVGATTLPAVGCLLAGFAFLVMLILQLIPKANRSRGSSAD